jgi:hypothetical protein
MIARGGGRLGDQLGRQRKIKRARKHARA